MRHMKIYLIDNGQRKLFENPSAIDLNTRHIIIGNNANIGDNASIGNNANIGDGATTAQLNEYFISTYSPTSIFWKWVTSDFMSPGWGIYSN